MPRKSDESAAKRKPSAAPKSTTAKKKTAPTSRTSGAKAKNEPAVAKKAAPIKSAATTKGAAKKSPRLGKSGANANARSKSSPSAKPGPPASVEEAAAKARKRAKKNEPVQPAGIAKAAATGPIEDPIGDTTDGEAHHLLTPDTELGTAAAMMEAYRADTTSDAEHGLPEMEKASAAGHVEETPEAEGLPHPEPHPEAHLDRLQKILSQAGIASRRHAEEMIVAGRVMVNGQTITQLGAKADRARDHIRVDGKLIQGAERHRTFVLNKPKGYVTTVSDPEGRPTVMQFFEKMRERLYPVGRLDYQSEGLLLMTNDGELANGLTRAAAGVEKTYLVKVAGQPSEDELDQLRSGVSIDREQDGSHPSEPESRSLGTPGSGRVRTAPASVRQVRPGNNPWYEVVLTEGRNRELRKMFQAIGHFVEKIRRVGYGPLVLDVEPGRFRELTAEEVNALRLTAEGKLKPRRPKSSAMLPKEAGRSAEGRQGLRTGVRSGSRPKSRFDKRGERRGTPPRDEARRGAPAARPFGKREERGKPPFDRADRAGFEKRRFAGNRENRGEFKQREGQSFDRPPFNRDRGGRPARRGEGGRERFDRSRENRTERQQFERPESGRPGPGRSNFERPRFDLDRPASGRQFEGRADRPGRHTRQDGQRYAEPRGTFGAARPRFEENPRFERPQRSRRGGFRGEQQRPHPDFPQRRESADRSGAKSGADRSQRPNRFSSPRFDRERGERKRSGEWKPRESGEREQRPPRRDGVQRFRGPGRAGSGNQRRRSGFSARPEGFRRPGYRGKPGGGPPRRDRG